MFRAALLDVDGVLVDSEEIYYHAVNETFEPYDVRIGRDEYVRRYIIGKTETAGIINDYGIGADYEEIESRQRMIVRRMVAEELQMMPHAMEMLQGLHGRYPLGVVTSADFDELYVKLGKFRLLDLFDVIVTADDTSITKPDPEPYRLGVERLGKILPDLYPRDVFVIEDNPSGVRSAKGAGCHVIAFPNGFTKGMDFSEADFIISDLSEINDGLLQRLSA